MSEQEKTLSPERIKAALPYGAINEVAKETGYSRTTIVAVIKNINNWDGPADTLEQISNAIIRVIEREDARKRKSISALSKAISA